MKRNIVQILLKLFLTTTKEPLSINPVGFDTAGKIIFVLCIIWFLLNEAIG